MEGAAVKVLQQELGGGVSQREILDIIQEMRDQHGNEWVENDFKYLTALPVEPVNQPEKPAKRRKLRDKKMRVSLRVSRGTWIVYEWCQHHKGNLDVAKLLRAYQTRMYDFQDNGDVLLYYKNKARVLVTPDGCQAFIPANISRRKTARLLKDILQMLENFKHAKGSCK